MKTIMKVMVHALIYFPILFLFEHALGGVWMTLFYGALTAAVAVGCAFVRWHAKTLLTFLGSHLLLAVGGIVMIPIVELETGYVVIWLVPILYSMILRLVPQAEGLDAPGYLYIGVMILVHLLAGVLGDLEYAQKLALWGAIILFLLNMLYDNLDSMEQFLELQSLTDKPDEKKVKSINMRLSLIYTGVFGVILALIGLNSLDSVKDALLKGLRVILRFLVSLLPIAEESPAQKEEIIKDEGMQNMLQDIPETPEPSRFAEIIAEILQVLMVVCLVALIIFVLVRAAIIAYRYFYKRAEKQEEDRVVEKLSYTERVEKKRRKSFFEGFERTPSKRIRKLYKKSMIKLGAKKMERFHFMTPEEQVALLREQGMDEKVVKEIKNIYEKARYHEQIVTEKEQEKLRIMIESTKRN